MSSSMSSNEGSFKVALSFVNMNTLYYGDKLEILREYIPDVSAQVFEDARDNRSQRERYCHLTKCQL